MIDKNNKNILNDKLNIHKIDISTLVEICNNSKKQIKFILENIQNYKYFIMYSSKNKAIFKYILYPYEIEAIKHTIRKDFQFLLDARKHTYDIFMLFKHILKIEDIVNQPIYYFLANDIQVDPIANIIKMHYKLNSILDITYYNNRNMNKTIYHMLYIFEYFITFSQTTNKIYIYELTDDIKNKIYIQLKENPIINIGFFINNIVYKDMNNLLITNYYLAY